MSFMYETMMTRGPGKRKIKLQEQNLLHIMQEDEDDEEDEDFQVNKHREKEEDESSDSSEDSSSASSKDFSSSETSSEEESNKPTTSSSFGNSRHQGKCTKQTFVPPTISSTNAAIKAQKHGEATNEILVKAQKQFELSTESVAKFRFSEDVKICCVCLKKRFPQNIVDCSLCGISVHKDCYDDSLPLRHVTRSTAAWYCASCINGTFSTCDFCPIEYGCLKETPSGRWCHIVCARYIRNKDHNRDNSEIIDVSSVQHKLFGLHECMLCEDRLVAKTGICVKCDAGLCRSYFHVTCAQKYGLLSENESKQNCDSDPYFVYCPLHMEKEKMAESQKLFIASQALTKRTQEKNRTSNPRQPKNIPTALHKERASYVTSQQMKYPILPAVGTPPARLLTSSPAALKMLNKKAELLFGLDAQSPATYFPKPSEVRKRHHVPPALTGEFASHYVDRELRIVEMQERIEKMTNENQSMVETQTDLEQKYENLQAKHNVSLKKEEEIVSESRRLFTMFLRLKMWTAENGRNSMQKSKFSALKPILEAASTSTEDRTHNKRKLSSDSSEKRTKSSRISEHSSSMLLKKTCSECNTNKHQHRMIECGVCKRWLHLQCLDPPLTHMPKKSKFSIWQCSLCASSSGSDSDVDKSPRGSLITSEGRRQTQRLHKPPEKLASSLPYQPIRRKNSVGQMRRMIEKGRITKRQSQNTLKRRQTNGMKSSKFRRELNLKREKLQLPSSVVGLDVASPKVLMQNSIESNKINDTKPVSEKRKNEVYEPSDNPATPLTDSQDQNNPGSINLPSGPRMILSGAPVTPSKPILVGSSDKNNSHFKKCIHVVLPQTKFADHSVQKLLPLHPSSVRPVFVKKIISPKVSISNSNAGISALPANLVSRSPTKILSTNDSSALERERISKAPGNLEAPVQNTKSDCDDEEDVAEPPKKFSAEKKKEFSELCEVCHLSGDHDNMMVCCNCAKHYHTWCCDPPIRGKARGMNKFYIWECSECQHSSEESDYSDPKGSETTSDGRRKITRRRKPPEKFSYSFNNPHQRKLLAQVKKSSYRSLQKRLENRKKNPDTQNENQKLQPKSDPAMHESNPPPAPFTTAPVVESGCEDVHLTSQKLETGPTINQNLGISSSLRNQVTEDSLVLPNQRAETVPSINQNSKVSLLSNQKTDSLLSYSEVVAALANQTFDFAASTNQNTELSTLSTNPEAEIDFSTNQAIRESFISTNQTQEVIVLTNEKPHIDTSLISTELETSAPETSQECSITCNDKTEVLSKNSVDGNNAIASKEITSDSFADSAIKCSVPPKESFHPTRVNDEMDLGKTNALPAIADIQTGKNIDCNNKKDFDEVEALPSSFSLPSCEAEDTEMISSCENPVNTDIKDNLTPIGRDVAEDTFDKTDLEPTTMSADTELNSSTTSTKSSNSSMSTTENSILSKINNSPVKKLVTVILPNSPTVPSTGITPNKRNDTSNEGFSSSDDKPLSLLLDSDSDF